jgi:hypothetical protein
MQAGSAAPVSDGNRLQRRPLDPLTQQKRRTWSESAPEKVSPCVRK